MPGMHCSVVTCKSNAIRARQAGEKITFFTFPKKKEIRNEWIRLSGRKDFNPTNKRICSKHFTPEDYEDRIRASIMNVNPRKLKENAVPSLYVLPKETQQITTTGIHTVSEHDDREIEIIYIMGSPHDKENEYDTLQRKYDALVEENKRLKKLLNFYINRKRRKDGYEHKNI